MYSFFRSTQQTGCCFSASGAVRTAGCEDSVGRGDTFLMVAVVWMDRRVSGTAADVLFLVRSQGRSNAAWEFANQLVLIQTEQTKHAYSFASGK